MTQNLRIGQDQIIYLSEDDSDIASSYSLPAKQLSGAGFKYDSYVARVYIHPSNKAYGGYYSWLAATAGTGTTSLTDGEIANSSICPKKWKLPSNDEMSKLYTSYGNNLSNMKATPGPNLLLAGFMTMDKLYESGSRGQYWTATAKGYVSIPQSGYYGAYYFDMSDSRFPHSGGQGFGSNIRCTYR